MAKRPMLVVVVVEDPGLRSALAAQLALSGINLLTAESFESDIIERRMIRQPSMLIIDEEGIEGDPGVWVERQWLDRAWERVVVLTVDMPAVADTTEWLVHLDRRWPAREIAGRVAEWADPAARSETPLLRFEVETPGNA